MSSQNVSMADLLKKQETERMDLAAGVYQAWQAVRQTETQVLSLYNKGSGENIPPAIQKGLDKRREDFFEEWGSDGRLAALMGERHAEERERIAGTGSKSRDHKYDRGR
jgi:hypothetical protein